MSSPTSGKGSRFWLEFERAEPITANPTIQLPLESIHPQFRRACILYAEDEKNDIFFLEHAFQSPASPYSLNAVPDGEQAIDYLAGKGRFADRARHPFPALVLLDINMPKKSGLEVLKWIRQQPSFKSLSVVMLTSSPRPEDMEHARLLGADDYLIKPSDPLETRRVGQVPP